MDTKDMYSVWDTGAQFSCGALCYCVDEESAEIVAEDCERRDPVVCKPGETPDKSLFFPEIE